MMLKLHISFALILLVVFFLGCETPATRLKTTTQMRVPTGFKAKAGAIAEPYTNTGWAKEAIHEKTGIEMVFIPAGEFEMGSPNSEEGRYVDEGPAHRVRIAKPFYMGKCEVTQGQWQRIMGNNPSSFKGDQNPVETVSWNNCGEFLKDAGDGLRLPTEAEWEYACRAGSTVRFNFGDNESDLGKYAWNVANSEKTTHVVGQKNPNAWGLFDMHGNVWEWCSDWYDGNYYSKSPVDDPAGPSSGGVRVMRGGCWISAPRNCRCALRGGGYWLNAGWYGGFRVVRGL